jgi:hypothetical protein
LCASRRGVVLILDKGQQEIEKSLGEVEALSFCRHNDQERRADAVPNQLVGRPAGAQVPPLLFVGSQTVKEEQDRIRARAAGVEAGRKIDLTDKRTRQRFVDDLEALEAPRRLRAC